MSRTKANAVIVRWAENLRACLYILAFIVALMIGGCVFLMIKTAGTIPMSSDE